MAVSQTFFSQYNFYTFKKDIFKNFTLVRENIPSKPQILLKQLSSGNTRVAKVLGHVNAKKTYF